MFGNVLGWLLGQLICPLLHRLSCLQIRQHFFGLVLSVLLV